jgi:hypothetical protein
VGLVHWCAQYGVSGEVRRREDISSMPCHSPELGKRELRSGSLIHEPTPWIRSRVTVRFRESERSDDNRAVLGKHQIS